MKGFLKVSDSSDVGSMQFFFSFSSLRADVDSDLDLLLHLTLLQHPLEDHITHDALGHLTKISLLMLILLNVKRENVNLKGWDISFKLETYMGRTHPTTDAYAHTHTHTDEAVSAEIHQ